MIYVTGDTHGMTDFAKLEIFANNTILTRDDYVIIAGDAGIVMSADTLASRIESYGKLPFTVLFVDGNHENFDMLESYDVQWWCGGKVHRIADNIIHLMRGQIFDIQGRRILTFGGADSTDRQHRIARGLGWWPQEVPSSAELEELIDNLLKVDFCVDYIITHSIDDHTLAVPPMIRYADRRGEVSKMLNYLQNNVIYRHWYFGHFHDDMPVARNKTLLYLEIVALA